MRTHFNLHFGAALSFLLPAMLMLSGCKNGSVPAPDAQEDTEAKRLLQGTWLNGDDESEVFQVRGDSIFYFDSSSQPAHLWVRHDSLYIEGAQTRRYRITKQAEHLLKFVNANGEEVKLTKAETDDVLKPLPTETTYAMNLSNVTDLDTMAIVPGISATRVRVHTEPTSDRIAKSVYNDLGVEVDNMYLDYSAHVILLNGATIFYDHTFRKAEFAQFVPREFLASSILRSVDYDHADRNATYLTASIGIPDAETCYVVELRIDGKGQLSKRLK